jgi:uncharacterized membrane protein YfcA
MEQPVLVLISFLTSAFNAAVGVGGGVLLIAVMTSFLPAAALVPIHGVVQLASNASRNIFGYKHTDWTILPPFLAGALLGTLLGSQVVISFPLIYLPLALGFFILIITWTPQFIFQRLLRGNFVFLGFLQAFFTLIVGATGPLNLPFLVRKGLSRDRVIVTHGLLMTITHLIKISLFGLLGFSYTPYLGLIFWMIIAVTAGSYFGTKFRKRIPEELSRKFFQWLITLLALSMILKVLAQLYRQP